MIATVTTKWVLGGALTMFLGACGGGPNQGQHTISLPPATGETATALESSDLRTMREEEKLARDVYTVLAPFDGSFSNIRQSEQRHMDAMAVLLDRYALDDPAATTAAGQFENQTLQELYETLVSTGGASREAALRVGVEIEELDIHDLEVALAKTDKEDIRVTYQELMRGSRNHLRAFYGQLTGMGASYAPTHLAADAFDAIVTSPKERGR